MVESYQWQTELWRGNHAGWKFSYQLMPVWLVCVPSSSKKEPLSSACGLLHCFLAYKPSSLLPVAFINYHMLPSCGCQLILHAQSCAQVETHKPFLTSCKALQLIEGALWLVLFLDCIMNLSISVVFAVVLRIKQKVKFFHNQAGAAQCHIALIQTVWFWWHDVIHKAMAEKRMCLDRSQPITADVASLCCPHRRLKGHSSTTGPRREHSQSCVKLWPGQHFAEKAKQWGRKPSQSTGCLQWPASAGGIRVMLFYQPHARQLGFIDTNSCWETGGGRWRNADKSLRPKASF